jgi:hypothetical protein
LIQAWVNSNIIAKDVIGMLYSVSHTSSPRKPIFPGLEENHDLNIVVKYETSLTELLWRFVWNLSDSHLNQICNGHKTPAHQMPSKMKYHVR